MYSLKELNQSLIRLWNEVYMENENHKDILKEILKEHKSCKINELVIPKEYPFTKNTLKKISALNVVEDSFRDIITEFSSRKPHP